MEIRRFFAEESQMAHHFSLTKFFLHQKGGQPDKDGMGFSFYRSRIPFSGWDLSIEDLLKAVRSRLDGLTSAEAANRLQEEGYNSILPPTRNKGLILFLAQLKSPLILLLLFAALVSLFLGGHSDAVIIFIIIFASAFLGYFQERGAINALEQMLAAIAVKAEVWRDGVEKEVPIEEIVPGDVVTLKGGDLVPADCILLETQGLFVDEASLTGESFPVEKSSAAPPKETAILKRGNALWMSSAVVAGRCRALVVETARRTQFGQLADRVRFAPPETAFEIGVKRFGYLLMRITIALTVLIFVFNLILHRPFLESLLFAVALAVGLTPQLLPAIISVNLSHGVRKMAAKKVMVKRLPSIENFGQMDILCSDKTGTLTTGKIELADALGPDGTESKDAVRFAALNAKHAAFANPLDAAILKAIPVEEGWEKIGEAPYDFARKRLIVLLQKQGRFFAIAKGAISQILSICSEASLAGEKRVPLDEVRSQIDALVEKESSQGYRLLGVALSERKEIGEEKGFVFYGFLRFKDPLKKDSKETIEKMHEIGVHFKILTGDHHLAALNAAAPLQFTKDDLVVGEEIAKMAENELDQLVKKKRLFAEIDPAQKEKIILALRRCGHVVGFLGDGINDVAALNGADVGIAVEGGTDAAKEACDIVLLEKDLSVIVDGVKEGRATFANTLKYIYMAASANFGNMFSMAGVSLFLPFLPLLPKQVLLINLLTDLPEMAIATDRVDPERVQRPLKWNLKKIRSFMLVFGLISSLFDYATFGVLYWIFHAGESTFRSAWFLESVWSATLIVLAIRTRRISWRSRPGKLLSLAIIFVFLGTLLLPLTPLGGLFAISFISWPLLVVVLVIVVLYFASVEIAKRLFYSVFR